MKDTDKKKEKNNQEDELDQNKVYQVAILYLRKEIELYLPTLKAELTDFSREYAREQIDLFLEEEKDSLDDFMELLVQEGVDEKLQQVNIGTLPALLESYIQSQFTNYALEVMVKYGIEQR
jgi:hypothetical protein